MSKELEGGETLKKVILASHGDLSKGMLKSLQMIIGETPCDLETFSLYPGENASDYAKKLEEEACIHPEIDYVIIADILGGSVHTAFIQILQHPNIYLYSGMNLSLVLEMVMSQDDVKSNSKRYLSAGKDGISLMTVDNIKQTESEEF